MNEPHTNQPQRISNPPQRLFGFMVDSQESALKIRHSCVWFKGKCHADQQQMGLSATRKIAVSEGWGGRSAVFYSTTQMTISG